MIQRIPDENFVVSAVSLRLALLAAIPMFLPYSTDAPIYHWPVATVGLIVTNTLIFIGVVNGYVPNPELWILPYGEGLTPLQWLSSMFMHAGLEHVLGNMLFLWIFGIVVEGKIGWWKFLLCYLGIGVLQSVGEQFLQLLLGGEGGSLGASSAIYGIMAMAAIWAPKNDILVFYWFFLILAGTGEIAIMMFAAFYIGYDVFLFFFLGVNSSSWLHVGGALVGAPLAIVMLKRGMVDCEGWDIFHVWRGETGAFAKQTAEDQAELARLQQQRDARILENADGQIVEFLQSGNTAAALALYQKLQHVGSGIKLPRSHLLKLIAALHQEKRWRDSCALMVELMERFPEGSENVRVKLAQICVVELQKPGKALDLLQAMDLRQFPESSLSLVKKIAQRAKQMQAAGVMELEGDAW